LLANVNNNTAFNSSLKDTGEGYLKRSSNYEITFNSSLKDTRKFHFDYIIDCVFQFLIKGYLEYQK